MGRPTTPAVSESGGAATQSRTRRSLLAVLGGWGFIVTTTLVGAVVTPMVLAALGAERYGAFRAMVDAFAYPALLEAGFSGSVMTCLAKALAGGNRKSVEGVLGSARKAYWQISAVAMLCGALLVAVLPGLLGSTVDAREVQGAGLILMGTLLLIPAALFRAIAEARQRAFLVHVSLTTTALLTALLTLGASRAGWGLPGQAVAVFAAALIVVPLLGGDAGRAFPKWRTARPVKESSGQLWRLNLPMFLLNLSSRLGLLSDNLMVAALLSPAAVAPFYLTQRIITTAQLPLLNFGNATWAGLADVYYRGEAEKFRDRVLELTGMVGSASLLLLVPVAAYNRAFVTLWVGSGMYAGDWLTVLATASAWLNGFVNLWSLLLTGTGRGRAIVPYNLAALLVNVAVSLGATMWLGWVGPVVGTLAGTLGVMCWSTPLLVQNTFAIPAKKLWWTAVRPVLVTAPVGVLFWLVAQTYAPTTWLQLVAHCSVCLGSTAAAVWGTMPAEARRMWRERLRLAFIR